MNNVVSVHNYKPAFALSNPITNFSLNLTRRLRSSQRVKNRPRSSQIVAIATRRAENVDGNVFVDESCINCDICRWLAPETFHLAGRKSAVHSQPNTTDTRLQAMRAAVSCPTGSIRTEQPDSLSKEATKSFPLPTGVPGIYFNGYSSRHTFGASSWLATSDDFAIMFDCPRYNEKLATAIEETTAAIGGVKYLVISHSDDVYGHEKWAKRLSISRVIHAKEISKHQGTDACELPLTDEQFPYQLAPGFELIHVPGHSRGSIALLHHPSASLFTGDHLASGVTNELTGFPRYNFYSWQVQIESVLKLKDVPFRHIWPGHGRQTHFASENEKNAAIVDAVERMKHQ